MASILEEGPLRKMLREKGILKHSPEVIPDYARKIRLNSLLTLITQKDIPDEESARNYYNRMSSEADALGLYHMAETLRKMRDDEAKHKEYLQEFVDYIRTELAKIV